MSELHSFQTGKFKILLYYHVVKLGGAGDRFGDFVCGLRQFALRKCTQSIL